MVHCLHDQSTRYPASDGGQKFTKEDFMHYEKSSSPHLHTGTDARNSLPPVHGDGRPERLLLIIRDLRALRVAGRRVAELAHAPAAKRLAGVGTGH